MKEPSQTEVLAWLDRTGRSIADAAVHFWPDADARTRERAYEKLRKWVQRARRRGGTPALAPPQVPTAAPREPPVAGLEAAEEAAALGRVAFLQRQLVLLLSDMAKARRNGDFRVVPQLDRRVAEVRAELDAAIELERQVVRLDRTATAICLELERRAEAIRIRAEIERRNRDRSRDR